VKLIRHCRVATRVEVLEVFAPSVNVNFGTLKHK
jgi:hypothetical protein